MQPSYLSLRRLAMMFLLVVLLPLAQSAAHLHLISHIPVAANEGSPSQPDLHTDQCELCLTAATLTAGAAPALALPTLPASARCDVFVPPASSHWCTPAPQPYQSRAPPSALI